MKVTKIVFFIMLIAANVISIYGMDAKPVIEKLSDSSWYKTLSEEDILKILQKSGDYEQRILEERANNIEDLQDFNWHLLKKAIQKEYPLLINFLIEKNINISTEQAIDILDTNLRRHNSSKYVIRFLEESDQKKLINFVIGKGIGLDILNKFLCRTVYNNCPDIFVEIFVQHGADVNRETYNGSSLLHVALPDFRELDIDPNRSRIINALLDAGADPQLSYADYPVPQVILLSEDYPEYFKQTDWGQRILGSHPLPKPHIGNNPLPKPHVGGNPGDNNPTDVIKAHKGFAFVGAIIGVGVVVWACKKLYAKYYDDKNAKEKDDDSEQAELVAD